MSTKFYYIGGTVIEVIAPDIIHKCFEMFNFQFKNTIGESQKIFLTYDFQLKKTSDEIFKMRDKYCVSLNNGIDFHLLNINYRYFEKEKLYIAYNEYSFGIIDIEKRIIKWYVNIDSFLPRSLFHLTILDPYSLLCPQINEIVVHGAVVSYDLKSSILFIGPSGSGKSTITHKLCECNGYSKICDDTFLIRDDNKNLTVYGIDTGNGYTKEIAKKYIDSGKYYELYSQSNKTYIIGKRSQNQIILKPKHIFFVDRFIEKKFEIILKPLKEFEALKWFINCQTNIGTPFLVEKIALYKKISQCVVATKLDYYNNCDIERLSKYIHKTSESYV